MFKFLNWEYKYFHKKLKGVKCMILDLEFKRFKTQEIREEIRQLYDKRKAEVLSLEERIELERKAKKMPEGDIKRLEDDVVIGKRDIERYEAQMKSLDLEVSGSNATAEYPEGVQGIEDQLEALHDLEQMLRDYMKNL